MRPAFAVAPNFHVSGGWSDRLLVAGGAGWRTPREDELSPLVAQAPVADGAVLLFMMPAHMRARFWAMLNEQAAEGTGDFIGFSADMRQFLTFKELPPPDDLAFELLVQDAGGQVDAAGFWGLVNFGEEPLLLGWPDVRLRLDPGQGCRFGPPAHPAVVLPVEEPNVMLAIRRGSAAEDHPAKPQS
jgi:hypothetical protein